MQVVCSVLPLVGAVQLMPAGLELTEPPAAVTDRAALTVSVDEVAEEVVPKVAVTVRAALIVTVQVGVGPVQAPLQPVKVLPGAAEAVSVTAEFQPKLALQVACVCPAAVGVAQETPAGDELTEPEAVAVPLAALTVSATVVALGAKLAVTLRDAVIASVQVRLVPVQAPLQPVKADPEAGLAVSVTLVPLLKLAEQFDEAAPAAVGVAQFRPVGLEVTDPDAEVLPRLAVRVSVLGARAKLAVTLRAAVIATVQVVAMPVQAPLQPLKLEPAAGVAVSVTFALNAKLPEQLVEVEPAAVGVLQLRPEGEEVTEPAAVEVPRLATTVRPSCEGLKVAVTLRTWLMATVQPAAVPVQAPVHPPKSVPAGALAVRVTEAPLAKAASQVVPQLMPAGLELTEPWAAFSPALATCRACAGLAVPRKPTLSRRSPVTTPLERVSLTRTALARSCARASVTLSVGWACLSSAQAPATCGAAIEVPSITA